MRYGKDTFNPHFTRTLSETAGLNNGWLPHRTLSILILQGHSLKPFFIETESTFFPLSILILQGHSLKLHILLLHWVILKLSILILQGHSLKLPQVILLSRRVPTFNPHFTRTLSETAQALHQIDKRIRLSILILQGHSLKLIFIVISVFADILSILILQGHSLKLS